MALDVGNKTDRERLHKAIKTSREAIAPFRIMRTEFVRDHAGSWYSKKGARQFTYVNKLNTSASLLSSWLAFNNPQCKITSFNPNLWPFCRKYEINVNKVVANIDFKTTFQAGVVDAFFLMGIYKVRMADAGEVELEDNVWIDPGKPWVDRISFDDAILDLSAKDIRAMRFCGDRYRVAYRKIEERDDFDRKVVGRIAPSSKFSQNSDGERASSIAGGGAVDADELEPMVWLEDIYLPETRQLVTFCADNDSLPPLKVVDSDAGPMGAYEFLSLGLVPDNIIPSSPAQNLKGLHDLTNRIYNKLAKQAMRQKTTFPYAAGAEDDATRQKASVDGEYFKMRDPKSVGVVNSPGVDGNTHAFFLAIQEIYNVQARNERVIGGLGVESDTVGQEKIVQGQATGAIAYMKGAVNDCARNILRKIGALMFDDEALTVDSSMEVANTGYHVDSSWRPDDRQGLKDHYDFSVEPNSMGYRPPEAKLQILKQFASDYLQIMPAIQAGIFDGQEFTKIYADYTNVPEILRIAKQMQIQTGESAGDPHQATKPANTSREVVRSRGNGEPAGGGMAAVLGQMMQNRGGGQQQAPMTAGVGA